jgi:hypothetical protein
MTKKTLLMVLAMLLMLSASAYASEGKDRGWFIYGILEHETLNTGIDGGGMLEARKALFGIGAEKAFSHRFLRKLRFEVMTGSATVEERQETKHWSDGVLVLHTIEHLTHRHSGRWKASLAAELSIGKGWYAMPAAEWSNSFMRGTKGSKYAARIGKRF